MLVWTVPSVHCSRPLPCTGTCSRGESCREVTAFCRCASPWGRALRERPPYRGEDREDHQHPDEVDGEQRREGYQEPPHFRAEDPRPCMSARHRNTRVTLTAAAHTWRRGEEGPRPAALLLAGAHPHAHVTEATRQGFRRVALEMPLALTINWKKLQLLVTMLRITLYMRRYFKVGDEEAKVLLPALLTPEPRDAFS